MLSAGGHGWPQRLRRGCHAGTEKEERKEVNKETSSRIDVCKDVEEEKDELMVC